MVTFRDSRAPNVHFALVRLFATCCTVMLCASDVNVELIAIATPKHQNGMIQHLSWSSDRSNLDQQPSSPPPEQ